MRKSRHRSARLSWPEWCTAYRWCAAVFIACCTWPSGIAAAPFGNPPVTRFHPTLDVFPQNFDITTGVYGEVLVASDDGVLAFDGERWSLLPMPNGDLVRSLSEPVRTQEGGRVYVGGYDLFGYLEMQPTGDYRFVDLTPEFASHIPENGFADIWDILVGEQGVLFRAVKHAFLFDPENPTRRLAWHRDDRFGAAFEMAGRMYMPFRGETQDAGLHVLEGDAWVKAAAGESFSGLVYHWIPLGDRQFLALQADGSWQAYGENGASNVTMPPGFPASSMFSTGLALSDKQLAFISDQGELYFLDISEGSYRRQRISNKYLSGIHRRNGGLLIVDDATVHHVSWPASWTLLDETQGITGSLHKAVRWNSRWILLGSSGVQEVASHNGDIRFEHRDWTDHEAWDLLPLDDSRCLFAESYELQLLTVSDGREQLVSIGGKSIYPRVLYRSRFDPQIVLVGTEMGLLVLRLPGNADGNDDSAKPVASILLHLDDLGAPGVNSIIETRRGEIWFGSYRGGIFRLAVNPDWNEVTSLERVGIERGIRYGDFKTAEVFLIDGTPVVTTGTGIFSWNGERFDTAGFDALLSLQGASERLSLRQAPGGELWAFNYRQLFRQDEQGEWREASLDVSLRSAIRDVTFTGSPERALVVAGDTILQFQGPRIDEREAAQVRLTDVRRIRQNSVSTPLPLSPAQPLKFAHDDVTLQFAFSLPNFHVVQDAMYQARLLPLEPEFSDWSTISSFTYYRLEPGEYQFQVRARDNAGNITAAEPYRFHVKPRWYNSIGARISWLALVLAAIFLLTRELVQRRLRRLRADKLRLEKTVASRTRELESANRQLQAMAHLDGLTEIANRRRLDEYLAEVWQQCREHDRPLSVLVIDVDHFKKFNDRFGHVAGDRLLQKLARMLSRSLRRSEDLVARYGGEEFLVVLPGARIDAATDLAEFMREHVEVSSLGATISIGVATGMHAATGSVTALVNAADQALYAAKAAGRNCVRVAEH